MSKYRHLDFQVTQPRLIPSSRGSCFLLREDYAVDSFDCDVDPTRFCQSQRELQSSSDLTYISE